MRLISNIVLPKNLTFFSLMLCIVWLSGCGSLVNDLDPDKLVKVESKLAVSCYISPQSPRLEAIITESQPLLGPASFYPVVVPNASVVLSDGITTVQLIYDDSLQQYMADTNTLKIVAGKTYTLAVNDGKRSVKAQCTVPDQLPKITNATFEKTTLHAVDTMGKVQISWQDVKGVTNYYAVRGSVTTTLVNLNYDSKTGDYAPFLYRNKQEVFYGRNIYNDVNLDGITFKSPETLFFIPLKQTITYQDKSGAIKSFYNDAKIDEVRLEVLSIDEHYYKFFRSLSNNNSDNPFVEPTLIYTNVEGGLGCFAAFNAVGVTLDPE
ncbi:DUF4249 domain-containing protein [Dyadobacter sp. CY326]|uniref:DUF4249 domain-containing protein n=1 Tax=Dyadobacter sp. CY326 TaxID=2907300 RepID=UPI001F18CDDB|nr:DUF4249 domain-containing protein [Dyadobacter sp. CY326]MCE7064551.1 DUF4249 domain-containing protein [Dyadobacter sp. CY326]